MLRRRSGVLLHLSALPGKFGCGNFGPQAEQFLNMIKEAGFSYWQILPFYAVNSGCGFSPYSALSTFAGNPLFISPEKLVADQILTPADTIPFICDEYSDFNDFRTAKKNLKIILERAFQNSLQIPSLWEKIDSFVHQNRFWINDYALFMVLSAEFQTHCWQKWPNDFAIISKKRKKRLLRELKERIKYYYFEQFIFYRQFNELILSAKKLGIEIIADLPIYVDYNSADCWANRELFELSALTGKKLFQAGVPPDYFSKSGQLWGNPLYRWYIENSQLNQQLLNWWLKRVSHCLKFVKLIRLDHFRGFQAYWSVPEGARTARRGKWKKGPGKPFFEFLKNRLRHLPFIAEDLGVITSDVKRLRDELQLPGMKVLQFAFDFNPRNAYLPCNFNNDNCVVYTGTHDNNTTNGWFYGPETSPEQKRYILDYLGSSDENQFHLKLIRLALSSTACLAIIPVQDLIGFGGEFRFNRPGTASGNWTWRFNFQHFSKQLSDLYRYWNNLYNRC